MRFASRDPSSCPVESEALVRSSQRGDREAFDALVDRYYEITFCLAYRMLGSPEDAWDATQEVFIKAWRSLPGYRSSARFSTWLHSIAVNHCLSVSRQRSRRATLLPPALESEFKEAAEEAVPAAPDADWAARIMVHDAVAQLPEKLKVVVTLYYFGQYSAPEIADELSLSKNTVYSRLRLAAERLGTALKSLEE